MKKMIALLLAAMMVLSMAACASKTAETAAPADTAEPAAAETAAAADSALAYIQAKGTDRTDVYVSAAYQDIPEGTEDDKGTTITVEFTTGGASD